MRQFLQGYKGSTRNFMAPVSESKFNADVMEFKDSNGARVPFDMSNRLGYATKNPDVIAYSDGLARYHRKNVNYTLSDCSEEATYYQLDFNFASSDKIGTISLNVNNIYQVPSPKGNTSTFEADFYLVDNYRQLRLFKKYGQNSKLFGMDLNSSDNIQVEYQLGRT
jgi:hypothetical protein